jgi:hypothetical protein
MAGKDTVQLVLESVRTMAAQVEIDLPLSVKATVPVGPLALGLPVPTAAVKMTAPPTADGFAEEESTLSV